MVFLLLGFVFSILTGVSSGDDACLQMEEPLPSSEQPWLNFTFLDHDAVDFGSTAFRVWDDELVVFIEAFPNQTYCGWDPETITRADIIIQNVHGHVSHYDPDECATVALNTGAFVVGNSQLKSDMTSRGVSSSSIIEMSPAMGGRVARSIPSLGVNITAYGMEHTFMSGTKVDTYLIEMPNGIVWYHGTCSSGSTTMSYMSNYDELKGSDVMIADTDMNFGTLNTNYYPETLIKDHDFNSPPTMPATVYENYPTVLKRLDHNDTYQYIRPDYEPVLEGPAVDPSAGDPNTEFTFSIVYKYRPDEAPTRAEIFIDGIPFTMTAGSSTFRTGAVFSYKTDLPPGQVDHHYEFEVDGKQVRYPSVDELQGPQVNAIPVLRDALVTPPEGDDETEFTFSVYYEDDDRDPAIERYMFLDGSKETMKAEGADPVIGINYTYTTRLTIGSHYYHFIFSDGKNQVRFPETGDLEVPDVVRANYAPVLYSSEFDPPAGYRGTTFTFGVKYRDTHGDPPTKSSIHLDGIEYTMKPMGADFKKGVTYTCRTELGLGEHSFHFEFSDGAFDVRYPSEEETELEGPRVDNRDPTGVISYPVQYSEFADDEHILLDASNSSDPDGDSLNFSWTSSIDGELGTGDIFHALLSPGQHLITLAIDDGFGGTSTKETSIVVTHFEAVLLLGLELTPNEPVEGQEITLKATASNSGNRAAEELTLSFQLDGTEIRQQAISKLPIASSKVYEANFIGTPGNHVMLVELIGGVRAYLNFTVTERPPPVAEAGEDLTIDLGEKIVLDASGSTFSGSLVSILWDFGDGQNGSGMVVEHIYSQPRSYDVTLTIMDELGKSSSDVLTVTVVDPIPVIDTPRDGGGVSAGLMAGIVIGVLFVIIAVLVLSALLVMKKKRSSSAPEPGIPAPPFQQSGPAIPPSGPMNPQVNTFGINSGPVEQQRSK